MMRLIKTLIFGTLFLLAACSGGSESSSTQASLIKSTIEDMRAALKPRQPLPVLTPQFIASWPTAMLELVVEERGNTAYLVPYSDRTDRRKGAIRTWITGGNEHLILREGLLIGTRGMGDDLGSARVLAALESAEKLTHVSGPHNLFVKDYDNQARRIDLDCKVEALGKTTIAIVQTQHIVMHLRQICKAHGLSITNDYWVSTTDKTIWQSRQWGGPKLGYLRMRILKI
jgi:hypothetical protein